MSLHTSLSFDSNLVVQVPIYTSKVVNAHVVSSISHVSLPTFNSTPGFML